MPYMMLKDTLATIGGGLDEVMKELRISNISSTMSKGISLLTTRGLFLTIRRKDNWDFHRLAF